LNDCVESPEVNNLLIFVQPLLEQGSGFFLTLPGVVFQIVERIGFRRSARTGGAFLWVAAHRWPLLVIGAELPKG
jgi:hypothetical protein